MKITEFIAFLIVFIAPSVYQRSKFMLNRHSFEKLSASREKSGLQIHHGHWGILIIFISTIYTVFVENNLYTILAFAYGWGLLIDEIIPSLKMPTIDRELELKVYSEAKKPTFFLILITVLIFITLFIVV